MLASQDRRTPAARLMDELGLRVADVSALAGCGKAAITSLRSGRYGGLQVRTVVSIAHALGVSPASLIPGFESRPHAPGTPSTNVTALERRVLARLERERSVARRASNLARREEASAVARVEARDALEA